jgi:hypothetical protein
VRNIRENRHVVVFGLPRHTRLEYNCLTFPGGVTVEPTSRLPLDDRRNALVS